MSIENCTDEELGTLLQCVTTEYTINNMSNWGQYLNTEHLKKWIDAITQEIKDREFEKTKEL